MVNNRAKQPQLRARRLWLVAGLVVAALHAALYYPSTDVARAMDADPFASAARLAAIGPWGDPLGAALQAQDTRGEATLNTQRPEVEWSGAGTVRWLAVAFERLVSAGDRVRTGPGAYARLIYHQGALTEIAAETAIVVQRLDRLPEGSLVISLVQTSGSTLHRLSSGEEGPTVLEVETPAANTASAVATPRVRVAPDGTTVVANLPGGAPSLVSVRGKDPANTVIGLRPGQQTRVRPGQPPSPPFGLDEHTVRVRVCQHPPPCNP